MNRRATSDLHTRGKRSKVTIRAGGSQFNIGGAIPRRIFNGPVLNVGWPVSTRSSFGIIVALSVSLES